MSNEVPTRHFSVMICHIHMYMDCVVVFHFVEIFDCVHCHVTASRKHELLYQYLPS